MNIYGKAYTSTIEMISNEEIIVTCDVSNLDIYEEAPIPPPQKKKLRLSAAVKI